nr:probable mediator of RNA polymerase II transcription subunit 26b [Tanacetum cinerariifolium]
KEPVGLSDNTFGSGILLGCRRLGLCSGMARITVVYEPLNKLHKMGLSFKVVDAADIGNTVSRLENHASKQVKHIAEMIIDSWMRRAMFDLWVDPYEKMPPWLQEKEQSGDLK